MKLTITAEEISDILLTWAQRQFPQAEFNTVAMETYTYAPNATFTFEEKTDEAQ